MTQKEFEDRIGRKVTTEEYAYADALYMNAGDIEKDDFCREYKTIKDCRTVKEVLEGACFNKARAQKLHKDLLDLAEFLIAQHALTDNEELRKKAISILGEADYIRRKIALGFPFDQTDYAIVQNILQYANI